MALKVWDLVDARLLVVREVVDGGRSIREAAERHHLSKSEVGRWVARYRAEGAEGLAPLSRRPRCSPGQVSPDFEDAVVRLYKERLGRWGAKKIRWALAEQGWDVPAVSTVQKVMARRGLVTPVRPRPARPDPGQRFERASSNELWQIDGTMHKFCNGQAFWVVDIIDDHSRFLVAARAGLALTGDFAWDTLRRAVAEFGQPEQLLSDNGSQFTGRLVQGGVTVRFERMAAAAGITLRHGRPYHPQTQGKIERQHQTQNAWVGDHRPRSLRGAQTVIDAYREEYNTARPHEGIGMLPPVRRYIPAAGVLLPEVELEPASHYPDGALLRRVDPQARFRYSSTHFQLDHKWCGVTVGLIRQGPALRVYYGHAEIQTFTVGTMAHTYAARKTKRT